MTSLLKLKKKLIQKVSQRTGKYPQYIREQISKRAHKHKISSEAELILWAKSLGIGYATFLRSLSINTQAEVRTFNSADTSQVHIGRTKVILKEQKKSKNSQTWHEKWWFKDLIAPFIIVGVLGGVMALIIGTILLVKFGIIH